MKVGDLVVDDKRHMDPSNWFYNAFYRLGIITAIDHAGIVDEIEVLWTNERGPWKTHEPPSSLVVISESR
jgi:hypothetical protein